VIAGLARGQVLFYKSMSRTNLLEYHTQVRCTSLHTIVMSFIVSIRVVAIAVALCTVSYVLQAKGYGILFAYSENETHVLQCLVVVLTVAAAHVDSVLLQIDCRNRKGPMKAGREVTGTAQHYVYIHTYTRNGCIAIYQLFPTGCCAGYSRAAGTTLCYHLQKTALLYYGSTVCP
jgi:hypothetical protein